MKAIVGLTVLVLVALVNADVSHLAGPSNHYLPQSHHHHQSHHAQYLPPHQQRNLIQSHQPHGHHQSVEEPIETEVQEDPIVEAATEVSDEVSSTQENEPAPAHSLDADGYHYKVPEGRRFFF